MTKVCLEFGKSCLWSLTGQSLHWSGSVNKRGILCQQVSIEGWRRQQFISRLSAASATPSTPPSPWGIQSATIQFQSCSFGAKTRSHLLLWPRKLTGDGTVTKSCKEKWAKKLDMGKKEVEQGGGQAVILTESLSEENLNSFFWMSIFQAWI